jgi:hypothetical protein
MATRAEGILGTMIRGCRHPSGDGKIGGGVGIGPGTPRIMGL